MLVEIKSDSILLLNPKPTKTTLSVSSAGSPFGDKRSHTGFGSLPGFVYIYQTTLSSKANSTLSLLQSTTQEKGKRDSELKDLDCLLHYSQDKK